MNCLPSCLFVVLQIPVLDVLADVLRLAQTWLRPCTNQLEGALVPLLEHANMNVRRVRVVLFHTLRLVAFIVFDVNRLL